jgi:hypothetical protein
MKSKPITEIALEKIQALYLNGREPKYLIQLYEELYPYVRSLLLKFIKNKVFLQPEVVADVSKDICLLVLDKYRNKPEFKIESSFAGYVKFKIMEILYSPQKVWEERTVSLNTYLSGDKKDKGKTVELGDMPETLKFDYLFPTVSANPEETFFKEDATTAISSVWTTFTDLFSAQNDTDSNTRKVLLVSLALLIYFRKDMTSLAKFKQTFIEAGVSSELYDLALLEIRNRLHG